MRIYSIISVFMASLLVGCENMGGFSKEQIGTTTGAVLGGIAGSFIGDGKGKWVAVVTGAALGGVSWSTESLCPPIES